MVKVIAWGALVLTCGVSAACSADDESDLSQLTQASTMVQTLSDPLTLSLPLDLHPQDVALGTSYSLKMSDRSRVVEPEEGQAPADIANAGAGDTYLGTDVRIGHVSSGGRVELRNRATVVGDVITGSDIHQEPDSLIEGTASEQADLAPTRTAEWTPRFKSGPGTPVSLEPDQSIEIGQGTYGAMNIKSRSTVTLSPGNYRFSDVSFEPDSKLILSSLDDPTVIYVDGSFTFRGTVMDQAAPDNDSLPILFVVLGQNQVTIDRPLRGTVYAPNAKVAVIGGVHHASFFGREVELYPDAHVVHEAFPWSLILPPVETKWEDSLVSLTAWRNEDTGEVQNAEQESEAPISFELPGDIHTTTGNGGNGLLEFSFRENGLVVTCTYQANASSPHPTSPLERMKGRRYSLASCSGGQSAGQTIIADWFSLKVLSGDGDGFSPIIGVELHLGKIEDPLFSACDDHIPPHLLPEEVVQLRETFSWEDVRYLEETDPDGHPAIWHGAIYINSKEQLSTLDRWRVFWSTQPLSEDYRNDLRGRCGIVGQSSDDEGTVVYAIFPAKLFNYLKFAALAWENAGLAPPFEFIIPSDPADSEYSHGEGSLKYSALVNTGFPEWLNQNAPGQPGWFGDLLEDFGSTAAAVFTGGASVPFTYTDLEDEAVNVADTVWEGTTLAFGSIVGVFYGTVDFRFKLRIHNRDPSFADFGDEGYLRRMWGKPCDRSGDPDDADLRCGPSFSGDAEKRPLVTPSGAKFRIRQWGLGFLPSLHEDEVGSWGGVHVKAIKQKDGAKADICIEFKSDYAEFNHTYAPVEKCNFGSLESKRDINRVLELDTDETFAFAQIKDSADYSRIVMGHEPSKADVLIGWAANNLLAGVNPTAADFRTARVTCFGFPGVQFGLAESLAVPLPLVNVADADIWYATGDVGEDMNKSRVMTHEYGHFAMCSMLHEQFGASALAGLIPQVFQGQNDRSDHGVMLESIADLFTLQVAGGVDYTSPAGATSSAHIDYCTASPCAERNYAGIGDHSSDPDDEFVDEVARVTTLFHDAFDTSIPGSTRNTNQPWNGDLWRVTSSGKLAYTDTSFITTDDEGVQLSGSDWKRWMTNWQQRGPNASRENVVGGLVDTMLESHTWCDVCEVLAIHDGNTPLSFRTPSPSGSFTRTFDIRHGRWQACHENSEISSFIGEPPGEYLSIDNECQPCPFRHAASEFGACVPCPDGTVARGTECILCDSPNTISDDHLIQVGNECVACEADQVSLGGECIDCPVGTAPGTTVVTRNTCLACAADAVVDWATVPLACPFEIALVDVGEPDSGASDSCPDEFWVDILNSDLIPSDTVNGLRVSVDPLATREDECLTANVLVDLYDVSTNGSLTKRASVQTNGGDWTTPTECDFDVCQDPYCDNIIANMTLEPSYLTARSGAFRIRVRSFVQRLLSGFPPQLSDRIVQGELELLNQVLQMNNPLCTPL